MTNNNNMTNSNTQLLLEQPSMYHPHTPPPLVVHARDCHLLMTNPRHKAHTLAQTTKNWLKDEAMHMVLGLHKLETTKQCIKKMWCFHDTIKLYNLVAQTNYSQNMRMLTDNRFCAQPTLLTDDCAIKIVTSWSAGTFPFFKEDVEKAVRQGGYEWQCRVYMMLFGIEKAMVSFCLVDTPQDGFFEGKLVQRWDNASLHNVESTVAPQKRVSTSATFVRDKAIEQKMLQRYEVANKYYQNYLIELYNK